MSFNTVSSSFGKNLRVTIFGGSHEPHIGVTIAGLPSGEAIDLEDVQRFLDRRAPGNSIYATPRKEVDKAIATAGLVAGKTTGEPLTLIIENTNTRSADYSKMRDVPRPAHADYTASLKYGNSVNMAGGGPFSARLTAPLCIAGALAMQLLSKKKIYVGAHIFSVAQVQDTPFDPIAVSISDFNDIRSSEFPTLSPKQGRLMGDSILQAMSEGDSVGGVVECCVLGVPPGIIGGPMYDGIEGHLSQIFFGIPAVKGVEFGAGFSATKMKGSENNDAFFMENGCVVTHTNNHGGILGGISSGMPILCRLAFKPTPSISKEQASVNLALGTEEKLVITGRHDPCVVLRAVPVVEAAAAVGILDLLLATENFR